ncbi:MAG: alpha/beta hydrolase [Chloroflexota bacterium]
MTLDPQARAFIEASEAAGFKPTSELSPAAARDQMRRRRAMNTSAPESVVSVEDRSFPGPAGAVGLRVYSPGGSGLPVYIFYHGGGWVIGDLDSHDHVCRRIANSVGCVVVSVDYRLAPEARFPAAAEDAYAALRWVFNNATSLGGDPARLAVGGDSAGGNLAAAVALMTRDRNGPRLVFQSLIYPVTDANLDTLSYLQNASGYGLGRADMAWFWDKYVPSLADRENPYCAPLQAADLSGLPPALVITAQYDTLRDEGEAYATRLMEAGVPTTLSRYGGQIHGFVGNFGIMDRGKAAMGEIAAHLKTAFS